MLADDPASNQVGVSIPEPRAVEDTAVLASSPNPSESTFTVITVPHPVHAVAEDVPSVVLVHVQDAPQLRSKRYLWPRPDQRVDGTVPYRVSDTTSCGLGVFATSDILQGELILRERPLIVYPQLLPYHSAGPPHERYPELEGALRQMSRSNQEAFHSLANCHPSEPYSAKAIIDTNALYLGPLPSSTYPYGAVCNNISRINHSCSPNAVYHFDDASFTFEVRALFPIPAGAQIFISYIDPALPRTERQELLLSYGFTCACSACSLTGPAHAQSETRRALIARADSDIGARDAALERWARSPRVPDDHVSRVDKMYMALFEAERLYYEPVWEGYAARLCKACCAVADRGGAVRWASLAAALSRAYTGSERGWDAVAAEPERTAWWGVRRGFKAQDASSA
ncbi:hypothetical protein BD413DRAFT_473253 [Trametes elegans]|nr:hypothetical protein BD413DRAFT_473253 [Trametes elegans]